MVDTPLAQENERFLINGKRIAEGITHELGRVISQISGRKPGLAFVLVGDNPASKVYVGAKRKACALTGIYSVLLELPSTISQNELIGAIERLNHDTAIDGILVQLPLPPHIDTELITRTVDPNKDIDGFHPMNVGKMLIGDDSGFLPCTPQGIRVLLDNAGVVVEGKHVVILGRSNIVGKPMAAMLMQKKRGCNATVTVAHSYSENLSTLTRTADILIAAIGKPRFVGRSMVKEGVVIIDVGMNRVDGKLTGDVDFEAMRGVASRITPVPGGVGPMTIAMLLQNTLLSYERRK